ncbi:TonB-dependent receptor plug domain-containing protein [Candidatus Omnitrophota bacterium]
MLRRCGVIFLFLLYCLPILAAEPKTLEKIVIAKPAARDQRYSIDSQYLENSSVKSLTEAFGLLGIDTQARSLNYGIQSDLSFRGLGFEGLTILFNGQRINDPQTGHFNADIPFVTEDIKEIELDPLKGTVNLIPKPTAERKNIFQNTYAEHETYSGLLSVSHKREDAGLSLSLQRNESEGFREGVDFKTFTASLYSDMRFSAGQEAYLSLGYNEKEFGAYDFYTPGSGFPSKEWIKSLLLNTGVNLEADGFLFKPRFLWRRHFDKFMLDRTQARSSYLNHHRTDVYAGGLSLELPEGFFDYLCLDTQFQEEGIESTRLGKHSRQDYRISMDMKEQLGAQMLLESTLAFDYFDSFKNQFSGSAVLSYLFSQHQRLSLGVSQSVRAPTFTEIYYIDPLTIGNINLLPEEWLTYELAYNYKNNQLDTGLAIFFRQEDDLINWVKKKPAELWQARNILEADCFGIEAHFMQRFNSCLRGRLTYAFIDKHLKERGWLYKYGPSYASHIFKSLLEFDLSLFSTSMELEYKKRPRRNGWFLLNLSVWRKLNKHTRVFFKIGNLLNVEYQDIEGIPSPGSWAEAGIRLEW